MDTKEKLLQHIEERLTVYANWISQGGGVRSGASEDLFCELLNTALGYELRNMNWVEDNFPAIDLGDDEERLAVQVTSAGIREKVKNTLTRFYDHHLEQRYDRLIVLIAGKADCKNAKFDHPGVELEIWGTAELMHQFRRLPLRKLREVDGFLTERVDAPRMKGPKPIHLPVNMSLGDGGFVGREKELAEMARKLEQGVKPLVIWGLGGMGKTALVSRFGRIYRGGRVYMALFRENLRQTVADSIAPGIPELKDLELSPEKRYELTMDRLRQCPAGDILIIDNADIPGGSFMELKKDQVYRELCGLPLRLVFTTRMQDRDGIELRTMGNSDLYQIFHRHGVDLTTEKMDALIAAVNAHTMTVDLMARTLDESWEEVTPEMILEAMASSTLPEADYPKVYNDRDDEQRQIYAHLRSLFNLSNIPEDGRQALRCATLLPAGGMDPALFLRGLPEGPKEAVKLLEKQGWVQREKHLLTIHPVVRLVCRTELVPTRKNCHAFVNGVWEWYDQKKYDKDRYRQMAELFENAADMLEGKTGVWAGRAGYLWNELVEPKRALIYNLRAVQIRRKKKPNSNCLAEACNNLGLTYGKLGDQKRALKYLSEALDIRNARLSQDHLDLAASYNNIGRPYGSMGMHRKALENELEALNIRVRVLKMDHPDVAASYDAVGYTYGCLQKHDEALKYKLKALEIRQRILDADHPDLARSYDNVGVTYQFLGDNERALEYQMKALEMKQRVLHESHSSIATSYNHVGITYGKMGDNEKKLEYCLKALEIQKQAFLDNNHLIARTLNNIAHAYYAMGRVEEAAVHMRRAAEIVNRSTLPKKHNYRKNYHKKAELFEQEARRRQGMSDPLSSHT